MSCIKQESHIRVGKSGNTTKRNTQNELLWTSITHDVDNHPFVRNVGPTLSESDNVFTKFFSNELVAYIVEQTNKYAKECLEKNDCSDHWETNEAEIWAFIGFTIMMGLNRCSNLYDYWSTKPIFHCFPIASRITRQRFMEIKRYLHFADNSNIIPRGEEGYKLAKIRPVIEAVQGKCLNNYLPHKECSIDEAMIRFKGRSTLKQYMPMKPIKRGIKVWVRADSHNGYISDFCVYTGKESDGNVTQNLGEKVVLKLSHQLSGGNYHLYFNNYFTSVKLLQTLEKDNIFACGTFRKDRKGIPLVVKNTKLRK